MLLASFHRYITEKFSRALEHKTIPIVLGATLEEYTKVAPQDSFLHVDNFTSPKASKLNILTLAVAEIIEILQVYVFLCVYFSR